MEAAAKTTRVMGSASSPEAEPLRSAAGVLLVPQAARLRARVSARSRERNFFMWGTSFPKMVCRFIVSRGEEGTGKKTPRAVYFPTAERGVEQFGYPRSRITGGESLAPNGAKRVTCRRGRWGNGTRGS